MSNTYLFERVCRFLEDNKLTSTLQTFRKEYERDPTRRTERLKKPVPADISKVKFDKTNPAEVSSVREVLQRADDRILNRLAAKMYKACSTDDSRKDDNGRLQKLKFYRHLVDKEAEANANRRARRNPNDISNIRGGTDNDVSVISKPEEVMDILQEDVDEYESNSDPGYQSCECPEEDIKALCKEIALKMNYPTKAIAPNSSRYPEDYYNAKSYLNEHVVQQRAASRDVSQHIKLPRNLKFPDSGDPIYPMEHAGVIYDVFNLKVVFDQEHTSSGQGTYQIVINDVVAGRYKIEEVVGQAQFSRAVKVLNLLDGQHYCMKIISNNKDYVDQSIDEIKLLTYINHNCNTEEKHVLRFYDYFYYKDHLFIVTELLQENLFEAYRINLKSKERKYFNLRRVQKFAKQIMTAMDYIHSLHIIHSDLKPENILMKSYSNEIVKVIDFGSSTFFHDNLSLYLQTRSYRAPEVILGVKYDEKIDIWSVGCILAYIYSGRVLFENQTVGMMLAKIQGILGGWPEWMIVHGQQVSKYFSKAMVINEYVFEDEHYGGQQTDQRKPTGYFRALIPKHSNLKARVGCSDDYFIDFLRGCLRIDPTQRLSAKEALRHPFITEALYTDDD